MKKDNKVYIELTKEQKEKLSPLFDEVHRNYQNPVMLLSQIWFVQESGDAVAICGIIPNKSAIRIQEAMNAKKIGKPVGESHAKKLLAKARK